MPGPDLQFQGSDGQTYQTYSAEQNRKLQEWYAKQQESKVQQMLDPWLKQQQAQARQQFLAQIDRQAVEDVERASKNWEGFDELRPHMHRLMAADKRVTLESAYRTAYNEHYLPIRDQRIIDKHDQELKQRAAAVQTPVSPTTRPAAAPGAVPSDQRKSIREQFKEKLSEFFPRTA